MGIGIGIGIGIGLEWSEANWKMNETGSDPKISPITRNFRKQWRHPYRQRWRHPYPTLQHFPGTNVVQKFGLRGNRRKLKIPRTDLKNQNFRFGQLFSPENSKKFPQPSTNSGVRVHQTPFFNLLRTPQADFTLVLTSHSGMPRSPEQKHYTINCSNFASISNLTVFSLAFQCFFYPSWLNSME